MPHVVLQQSHTLGGIPDIYPCFLACIELLVGQTLPRAHGFYEQPAPEPVFVAVLEGLSSVGQNEADALFRKPLHGGEGLADQNLGHVRVGHSLGDSHHVVVELFLGVAAHIDGSLLGGRHVGNHLLYVFKVVEGETYNASGEVGIATSKELGGFLHHQHGFADLFGGHGRGKGGVAGADYNYVVTICQDAPPVHC